MHTIEPEELMAYLDGELAPKRALEAAQHLSHCRQCQSAAADLQGISRRLLEWQIEELGPRIEQTINSARPLQTSRPLWKRGVPWIAGLAGACMVLLLVLLPPQARNSRLADVSARLPLAAQLAQTATTNGLIQSEPLIARTAQITLTTTNFAQSRAALDEILKRHGGHIGNLSIGAPANSGQTLVASLRIPANRLDAALAEIRRLGRLENESQGGEEVTGQMIDLEARLANARSTERRLSDILRGSTGKIADVLAVEKEMDRVRGEIERMTAEHKNLGARVSFATLEVRLNEEYKARLEGSAPSLTGSLRNAAVDGYRNVAGSLTGIAMFVLAYGPALVLWSALLFFPSRYAWRRLRR